MKKILYILAACAVMASCTRYDIDDVPTNEVTPSLNGAKKFTFTIKGDFTNPDFLDGNASRANSYMTADGAEMTDLWVVDYKDGEIKQELHQKNTDADWGSPTMPLTLGNHHVLFLASRGSEPTYANGTVTFTKPLDTFYLDYEVTVVKTSNGNRAVTLNRVSTKIVLAIEDVMPSGTTAIVVKPSIWYNAFDMLKGKPLASNNYEQVFNIPTTWGGQKGMSLTSWSLSSAEEWTTDIRYTSYAGADVNGDVLIKDAPFKANRATMYSGMFYTAASASSISLSSEWLPSYEGVY